MKLIRACSDESGTTAIEFAVTAPLFFLLLFAIFEGGLLMWTQLGLQHATEAAARCATINTSTCSSTTAIRNYAAQQAYGLSVSATAFAVSSPACGNQVSASYTFQFATGYFGLSALTLNAQSCFPKWSMAAAPLGGLDLQTQREQKGRTAVKHFVVPIGSDNFERKIIGHRQLLLLLAFK
jgi:Flp pilus assembly protein TadG